MSDPSHTLPPPLPIIGWREWIGLPELGIEWLKCKVDTGARTSAIHAVAPTDLMTAAGDRVQFGIHPWQGSEDDAIDVDLPIIDRREVRSSNGEVDLRTVVRTTVRIGPHAAVVDLTLTRRDDMGFRMLLGREAMERRFVVDPGSSYLMGRPPKTVRNANRRRGPGRTSA